MVRYGNGYLMVASDGGVFDFSTTRFLGSLAGVPIPGPIVGIGQPRPADRDRSHHASAGRSGSSSSARSRRGVSVASATSGRPHCQSAPRSETSLKRPVADRSMLHERVGVT